MKHDHLHDDEDAELRRLAGLRAFGIASPAMAQRLAALQARDRRRSVRALRAMDAVVVVTTSHP